MSKTFTLKTAMPFGLGEIAVDMRVSYRPGRAPTMYARNGDPGDPGYPPEVEFISATTPLHQIDEMMQKMVDEWCEEYLAGDGYAEAVERAEDIEDREREYAAELRVER